MIAVPFLLFVALVAAAAIHDVWQTIRAIAAHPEPEPPPEPRRAQTKWGLHLTQADHAYREQFEQHLADCWAELTKNNPTDAERSDT